MSIALMSVHRLCSLQSLPHPASPRGALAQAAELGADYEEIIKRYKLSLSAKKARSPRLEASHAKAPLFLCILSF